MTPGSRVFYGKRGIMKGSNLKSRTRDFGLQVIRFIEREPQGPFMKCAQNQLIRSGTSVGANYHEACRARSRKEFISKLEIVIQELEESRYWLELIRDYGCSQPEKLGSVHQESAELLGIMTSSVRTAKLSRNPHR